MEFSLPAPKLNEILGQFSNKWLDFVSRFHCHQEQNGTPQVSFLLHFGSKVIKEMQECHQLSSEDISKFSSLVGTLEQDCLFQIVLSFSRYLFFNHDRKHWQDAEDFYTELKLLSEWCSLDSVVVDKCIKNQIISSFEEENVREIFVNVPNLTARDVVDVCVQVEKHGSPANAELFHAYVTDQQHGTFEKSCVTEEDCVWSSFKEVQGEINKGPHTLSTSTVLQLDLPKDNDDVQSTSFHSNTHSRHSPPCQEQSNVSSVNPATLPPPSVPACPIALTEKASADSTVRKCLDKPVASDDTTDLSSSVRNLSSNTATAPTAALPACTTNFDGLSTDSDIDSSTETSRGENRKNSPSTNPCSSKADGTGIPQSFCSQQKVMLKTSQIIEIAGQNIPVYECNFCIFKCPGIEIMEEHVEKEHKSLECFVCTACNAKCPSKELFEIHFRTKHMNIEENKCRICDMALSNQKELFVHLHGHGETRTVTCQVCSAMFSTEKLLLDHMAQGHPDPSTYGVNFSNQKSSDIPVRRRKRCDKSKPLVRKFPCDICSHVSSSNMNLMAHRRTHTGEKPYICDVCGKGFAQIATLEIHLRTHTGEKPYKCQYCGHGSISKSNRLVHERIHTKERPYVCEKCGETFRVSTDLKMHIERTHSEFRLKKFMCHCGKAFYTKRQLKRHEACHSGSKSIKV